ncbi:hypothetical protein QWJ26_26165 [Streptomyces sp. CSDS2]|uniref:hypothetical protein n=1 Tax=Streptomyces sp. CSDS2 TaxID=3055051 RepID=UPI0025B1709D|nr:hypothetical protein [Streptomyces sp. CSDS2]MDN3263238.1 hypothetical protein [Streptomyces sp. CSDS2]
MVVAERAGEVCAITLVHLRDGHGTDGMLARVNKALDGLGKPPLADVRAADAASAPVGVIGKVLKRRLRQAYAGTADRSVKDAVPATVSSSHIGPDFWKRLCHQFADREGDADRGRTGEDRRDRGQGGRGRRLRGGVSAEGGYDGLASAIVQALDTPAGTRGGRPRRG